VLERFEVRLECGRGGGLVVVMVVVMYIFYLSSFALSRCCILLRSKIIYVMRF